MNKPFTGWSIALRGRTARSWITAVLAMAAFSATAFIQNPVDAQVPTKVTEVEGITEYKLDNGAKLLLFPDKSKPEFTINVTILAGSRHEGYGETGMAHLLEHMLFKGTPRHKDIPALLKERGVLNMNGTTWVDRTNYYETLPSNEENLEFAIDMEADRLINSTILGEDLNSEMTVVRNEFERGENSPFRILYQRIMSSAFEWHNYGKSTIGNRSDIERVQIPNLRAFYRKFYQPDNIMIVLAGDFETDKALSLVQKHFGAIPRPERELPKTYTEEPVQDGERVIKLRRVGDYQVVGAAYHIPAAADPSYPAFQVLMEIMGNEPQGPLYKNLVVPNIASSISAQSIATHDPGVVMVTADVNKENDLEAARKALIATVDQICEEGVSEEDVKRAITKILKRRDQSFANTSRFAIDLSEWEAYGDWRLYFLHRDRLEKVTPADILAAAKTYLVEDNRTIGLFMPTKEPVRAPLPATPNLEVALNNYKGRAAIAAGEAFEPTPENIDARTVTGELTSGAKYAFLEKKTRGERVFLNIAMHYGDENTLAALDTATSMLPQLLSRGTQTYSFQEFKDRIDELNATVGFSGGAGNLGVSIQARRESLPEVLEIVKDALRNPLLDGSELDIIREQALTQMESTKSDPQMIAITEFRRRMTPFPKGDIRYIPTIEENIQMLKDVTIEEVKKVHSEFLGGQHVEIGVVGDFDADPVREKLEEIFGGWETNVAYARIETPANMDLKGERVIFETPDKKNAVYVAGVPAQIRDDSLMYEAMLVGNYIMGGGPLSSRLADRVRKKEGLSYTAMSQFQADSEDERGVYLMFMISNPSNMEKVVDTTGEEVTRMLDSGVSPEELESAKESYLETRRGRRAQDGGLAALLARNLRLGRDMKFAQQSDEKIEVLSKEQVDQAVREMIDPERMIIITAGDFESVEESSGSAGEPEAEPAGAGN